MRVDCPRAYEMRSAPETTMMGNHVASSPTEKPAMMFVAGPVSEARAISLTGRYFASVSYCVIPTYRNAVIMPAIPHAQYRIHVRESAPLEAGGCSIAHAATPNRIAARTVA